MTRFKPGKHVANLLLVVLSCLLGIALFGPFFWALYAQDVLPRALVRSAGRLQSTFYPATFDRANLQPYTAILGDSYGQGMGDAFLSGEADYSVAHHLRRWDGGNYLVFARAGYSSISAARELPRTLAWAARSPFVPDLDRPEQILFFFYEGNDVRDNLRHLVKLGLPETAAGDQLRSFLQQEIAAASTLSWRDSLNAWLPFFTLVSRINRVASDLFREPEKLTGRVQASPSVVDDAPLEQARRMAEQHVLQSAMGELDEPRLQRGVDVFLVTLEGLRLQLPGVPIRVVYIPSPITCYDLVGEVPIHSYYSGRESVRIPVEKNAHNHAYLKAAVMRGVAGLGIELIDATAALQAAGRQQLLHGPQDYKHLNAVGYRVLAQVIAGPSPVSAGE